jgi:hypothetical protein
MRLLFEVARQKTRHNEVGRVLICQAYHRSVQDAPWGAEPPDGLLDLGFFVDHVLTNNRIVFLQFQFFGHGALVLGRGVEVTSACA